MSYGMMMKLGGLGPIQAHELEVDPPIDDERVYPVLQVHAPQPVLHVRERGGPGPVKR